MKSEKRTFSIEIPEGGTYCSSIVLGGVTAREALERFNLYSHVLTDKESGNAIDDDEDIFPLVSRGMRFIALRKASSRPASQEPACKKTNAAAGRSKTAGNRGIKGNPNNRRVS